MDYNQFNILTATGGRDAVDCSGANFLVIFSEGTDVQLSYDVDGTKKMNLLASTNYAFPISQRSNASNRANFYVKATAGTKVNYQMSFIE